MRSTSRHLRQPSGSYSRIGARTQPSEIQTSRKGAISTVWRFTTRISCLVVIRETVLTRCIRILAQIRIFSNFNNNFSDNKTILGCSKCLRSTSSILSTWSTSIKVIKWKMMRRLISYWRLTSAEATRTVIQIATSNRRWIRYWWANCHHKMVVFAPESRFKGLRICLILNSKGSLWILNNSCRLCHTWASRWAVRIKYCKMDPLPASIIWRSILISKYSPRRLLERPFQVVRGSYQPIQNSNLMLAPVSTKKPVASPKLIQSRVTEPAR